MLLVLFKALSFIIVIAIGCFGRYKGFFKDSDSEIITKLVINITLPAAVLSNFSSFEREPILFLLFLLFLGWNLLLMLIGYILSRKGNREQKIYYMMNLTAYNIGSFSMPFVQGFFGGSHVIATCMFDSGNALIASGGSYAIVNAAVGSADGSPIGIKDIGKKLLTSPALTLYVIVFFLALIDFKMPEALSNLLSTTASANGFLAMLMFGLTLKFNVPKDDIREIIKVLTLRYILSAIAALVIYFVIPFPEYIKIVLTILVFSPSSALVPTFTQMSGGNTSQASLSGSISIVISIIIISTLMVVLHV